MLVSLVVVALAALVPTVNSYVAQRQKLSELQSQVAQQQEEAAKEGEWYSTLWESLEGSSRLTPEDIPDETGSTDEDVPQQDPDDTTDQDADQ